MTTALVLGGYGLIGSACVTAIGMGRSARAARRVHPDIDWAIDDIARLSVADWRERLEGVDIVVNAAGALQDGARDDLRAIHEIAVANLLEAAAGRALTLVQISAAGVSERASTEFFRSKARGDALVVASACSWVVLRPTLAIGANAYGGTSLLRGVAGFPGIGARVLERSPVQTVALPELAEAVADCATGAMPMRRVYDLTEAESRSFGETVALVRDWLGFAPVALRVPVPGFALRAIGLAADGLGWLGWRSPMRTAALRTLAEGVTGDPAPWREAGGRAFGSLPQTLAKTPAALQERWFARLYLVLPLVLATLAFFWLVSGVVGLWRFDAAVATMTTRGFGEGAARLAVAAGSVADIALGAAILFRPWAQRAAIGMILVSLGYMAGAAVFAPDLWADPLGPMVKTFPSTALALVAIGMLEDR